MSDYHFEKKDPDFDMTIRLDTINEQVKQHELSEDDLGDKNAYLDIFESEHFGEETTPLPPDQPTAYDALKNRPHQKSKNYWNNPKFYGILALVCVILAIMGFAFARNVLSTTEEVPEVAEEVILTTAAYLVEDSMGSGEYSVRNTTDSTTTTIIINKDTQATDAKGDTLSTNSMKMGDLVWLTLDETQTATEVSYENITQVQETNIQVSDTLLDGDNGLHTYSSDAIFQFKGKEKAPTDLEPSDVVVLYSIDDVVWSVEILEYHGFLSLSNVDSIVNGVIEINGGAPISIDTIDRFVLPAGEHTISISGDTVETSTDTIHIVADQEYFYDLANAQTKMGVVLIQSNVDNPRVYIDGSLINNSETIVLPYDTYDLVVLKNGYEEWNSTIKVTNTTMTVGVEMIQMASDIGVLSLTANVDGDVYIEGSLIGETPLDISLPYGSYHVEVKKTGYDPFITKIYINTNMISLSADLHEIIDEEEIEEEDE
ncbi:PEGA domain-containing protein [Chakrabartyella piscis]|uniref:PEGA domain-containing protein n=1 Tax=Chakrabartyella piscis TaxID=2918914 RepID=UPI002958AF7B|nr:PEGA domain-containing protein [Chakrabartyella piscis]